ncbi:ribonuclease T2 [Yoonia sp.]|uniref:ribonuclease T2 n=1 Tax=Yoonia sp. TaxID=2212373 RepID=UPI001A0CF932|nr:ribonuclease T2 [Yoonia sp.]MBE0412185.1 ribonuclease T2 [Yoonia sp.]
MRRLFAVLCLFASPVRADDRADAFDYYILSLSWSANWCALEGDARNSPQCDAAADFDWVLHGLWPQYATGYPSHCQTSQRPPSQAETAAMAEIMGTSGLAWYQWRKHGSCTGLPAARYFAQARAAFNKINRPAVLRRITRDITLPASVIEDAFLRDNPGLTADQITITCKQGYIQEARICLTRDLVFRTCGADVIRDCSLRDALLTPMR